MCMNMSINISLQISVHMPIQMSINMSIHTPMHMSRQRSAGFWLEDMSSDDITLIFQWISISDSKRFLPMIFQWFRCLIGRHIFFDWKRIIGRIEIRVLLKILQSYDSLGRWEDIPIFQSYDLFERYCDPAMFWEDGNIFQSSNLRLFPNSKQVLCSCVISNVVRGRF